VSIALENVEKRLGGAPVLSGVSLAVERGEGLLLLGPSGAGKTTLLRIAAGLLREDAGRVVIGGEVASEGARFLPPRARGVGIVFQDLALFPHMSALENVLFALGASGLARRERRRRAEEALALARADGLRARYPGELSRGEAQRVAIARAIAPRPRLLLLDEPFAHLDPALRDGLRAELDELRRALGFTAIAAAHMGGEWLPAEGRAAVLVGGRVEQVGPAGELYARPKTRAVAELTGPASFLFREGRWLVLRPEQVAIAAGDPARAGGAGLRGRVAGLGLLGGRPVVRIAAEPGGEVLFAAANGVAVAPGQAVALEVKGEPAGLAS
jgi:ABC-type Fe3+/spermidine/putrescine transport system ATPase subunit